ncbi:MAG: hypothetical protein L3J96_00805 [Thermoplasmata archaeon]|nr:hypothetical protein [Thermoplasmata archaeon]
MASVHSDLAPSSPPTPSIDRPRSGASTRFLGLLRWTRAHLRPGPWLFVLLAGAGPLLWSRPFGDLLFGQDSTRLFQPFSFNVSPLVPYSYLFSSTFPVPDFTPYFYVDATLRLFDDLGSPQWFSERLVIGIFAGVAAAGIVFLLRAVDRARVHPVTSGGIAVGVASLVYVYNPFTLSVTFWHIEGWTLFLAFLPWVAALAVRVVHERQLPLRFAAVVTLAGVYLAPGAISSFAVAVGLVLLWAVLATWVAAPRRPFGWRNRVGKTLVLLGVGLGVEGWSFVPFLLIPNLAYTSNNYVTPENLLATYSQASATWGPYPVLTLTAFSWLVRTPSAYPWIGLLPTIAVAAIVFPIVVVLGASRLRRSPGSLLVYAAGLSALPFVIGAIAPIADFQIGLLRLGGPFLVIVAGYYILAPLYLLVVVVGLHETWRSARRPPDSPLDAVRPRVRWRSAVRSATRPSGLATIVIAALLLLSALPFALGDVYQTQGPNADVVALPPSYEALGDFFGTPTNGADYYLLVIPMSAQNGVYLNVSGHQFLDTANLLASFVPYPLLETNNGPTAASLETLLAAGPPTNLPSVLADLHVRYVLDNPYANQSAPTMNEAPGGLPIDYGSLRAALREALGAPKVIEQFQLYTVPDPIPLGWSTSQLVGVETPNAAGTLAFIGAVTGGPSAWTTGLRTALWSPDGSLPGWLLRPSFVSGVSGSLTLPPGDSATSVDPSGLWHPVPCGSGTCDENGTTFDWTGQTVAVQGPVERNTSRAGDYSANQPQSSGGYCAPSGSPIDVAATGPILGPALLQTTLTLTAPAVNNWATVSLVDGNLSVQMQAYQQGAHGPAIVSIAALNHGTVFAWRNVNLPADLPDGASWSLTLDWNASSADASLVVGGASTLAGIGFGDRSEDTANPGFNETAAPLGPVSLTQANESITLTGGAFCLQSSDVAQRPDVSYLVATGPGAPTAGSVGTTSSVTSSGDVRIDVSGARYAVLGYPYNPLWAATAGTPVSSVLGAPLANVVALAAAPNGTTVTLHFRTWILVGLDLSFVEVGTLVAMVGILTVRPRWPGRWRRADRPTSTPDESPRAPPQARTRCGSRAGSSPGLRSEGSG